MEHFDPNPIPGGHPLNTRPEPGFDYDDEDYEEDDYGLYGRRT